MSVGFYDTDTHIKPKKLLLNLELMKVANYYREQGEAVILENDLSKITNHDKFFIFRDLLPKQAFKNHKSIFHSPEEDVKHFGLAYTNGKYVPLDREYEEQEPYLKVYSPYLIDKVQTGQMGATDVEKVMNSHYIRLKAGDYEMNLEPLDRRYKVYIYDTNIEEVSNWEEKLHFIRENLCSKHRALRLEVVNGFNFTSFENMGKFLNVEGTNSLQASLFTKDSYLQFVENLKSVAERVSSRDGFKYHYGADIDPNNISQTAKELNLSINKYFFAKSINKACEFIVSDNCADSPIYKFMVDFQYWTAVRIGDQTLEDYLKQRNKKTYAEILGYIDQTPYKAQFQSLIGVSKNSVKEKGWYYRE